MARFVGSLILFCCVAWAQRIDPSNVEKLQVAWRYAHGENGPDTGAARRTSFSATPVLADGKLILVTPKGSAIALDAKSGREVWKVPRNGETRRNWGAAHAKGRVFYGTPDGKLICLLAKNGEKLWEIDLRAGLYAGHLSQNMPPAIFGDLVITGGEVPEATPQGPEGMIRAWRQSDGSPVWEFHTVPRDGEPGAETWAPGSRKNRTGVNVWGQCAVDEVAGALYCPTGSPSYDFYGADRKGAGLYANSVVALDGKTGKLRWHRQLVHHDLWDYDLPAKPVLFEVKQNGKTIPALAQITKMSLVWILDRRTGEPIFGFEERAVPQSTMPGEESWPTQPFPLKPAPLSRTALASGDLNTLTPEWEQECRALYEQVGRSGLFTPWEKDRYTLIFPGLLGGGTWSGGSFDAARRLLFVNSNDIGYIGKLTERDGRWMLSTPPGQARFTTKNLVPCTVPPWNTLNAIDVDTGEVRWRVPLGELPEAKKKGFDHTGAYGLGGSLALPSGVLLIGGSADSTFRAFDAASGKTLWEQPMKASVYATPMSFVTKEGREFVVVAAGGGSFFAGPMGDELVAFTLPETTKRELPSRGR
ncbi:PQQ-binding-like beta-propeller repeat protein [Bryobacter aggregatus]|uniref:outer membrane protein assembly factor BamB family protein n=1 Tax=Bryobacter aggregatus TaxID=360054 RepID=UPI000689FF95|nr:PQQ-binding-like beta-propeller repeat protein [Bryobacter aggregatus]